MPKVGHVVEYDVNEIRNFVSDAASKQLKKGGVENAQGLNIEFLTGTDGKLSGARVVVGGITKEAASAAGAG